MNFKGKVSILSEIQSIATFEMERHPYPRHIVQWVLNHQSVKSVYQVIVKHESERAFGYEALSRPQFKQKNLKPDFWFRSAWEHSLSLQADIAAIRSSFENFHLFNFVPLFINVMPSSFVDRKFVPVYERLLYEFNVPPDKVVLEIVEFSSCNSNRLNESAAQIRALGSRIALDDVGTGQSNLSCLVDLKPDLIKIDRSLVQGIATSTEKQRLLSLFVEYMNHADAVIAEGIETVEDLQAVIQSGVKLSQGFHWGYPAPIEKIIDGRW
ncbi:EAL domain-containing protein [Alicyclobacillus tolerans]|uniref:EAL domain-containing protein n=1 Tax=Alicyclobacillus tolerans TaxID=90970 RepID=UPI001F3593D9|nr:EAL domain-containing protein [Alicyclobacillus tolerans]MCF8568135.1 EAL domain-containing protein [Alicyclobacillus tolerans]